MNHRAGTLPAPGSEEEERYLREIEEQIRQLELVKRLSVNEEWISSVGIFSVSREEREHNLTLGTLAGPGKISVPPLTFHNPRTKEYVVILHVGQDLCGHRGLVHGGFLATILDECLGKIVFLLVNFFNLVFHDPSEEGRRHGDTTSHASGRWSHCHCKLERELPCPGKSEPVPGDQGDFDGRKGSQGDCEGEG
jgi:hypothetical protein